MHCPGVFLIAVTSFNPYLMVDTVPRCGSLYLPVGGGNFGLFSFLVAVTSYCSLSTPGHAVGLLYFCLLSAVTSLYVAVLSRLNGGSRRRLAVAGLDRRRSLSMLRIVTTMASVAPAARHSLGAPGAGLPIALPWSDNFLTARCYAIP